ncbi:MAG TPA: transposase [Candidatus Dormibacteraeota bacterium]|nr:transposase [Candidatus Dormibacteraeota bacterium]
MARPLRVLMAGGWYHVSSRGNRRAALFLHEADRRRFLGLLSEVPERFGVEIHAFVLMDNHYHLVVRTPEPNLSHAIRWLNVGSNLGRAGWRWKPSRRVVGVAAGASGGRRCEPTRRGRCARDDWTVRGLDWWAGSS